MASVQLIFYAVCWLLAAIKFTNVRVIGIPIIISEIGSGIYCLKTLAINMPMDEAEKAVNVYVTLLG